jgi:hypothetical protein
MKRTINSTGRRRIARQHVSILLRAPAVDARPYIEARFDLQDLELPAQGRIVIEAFRHELVERFDFGTVADPRPEEEPQLQELTTDRIAFRVKVVEPDTHRLLALARRIPPVGEGEEGAGRRELFRVRRVPHLGEELWRVVVEEDQAPLLELNSKIFDARRQLHEPDMMALIVPAAMRAVLLELAMGQVEPSDDEGGDSWRERWFAFAGACAGDDWPASDADPGERQRWIHRACTAFAARHGFVTGMIGTASSEERS